VSVTSCFDARKLATWRSAFWRGVVGGERRQERRRALHAERAEPLGCEVVIRSFSEGGELGRDVGLVGGTLERSRCGARREP
jgi:hypothetical protein